VLFCFFEGFLLPPAAALAAALAALCFSFLNK